MPLAALDEADAAIAARRGGRARRGQPSPPADRGLLLRRFSDLVGEHLEELALLEVRECRAHDRQRALGGRQRP